MSETQEPKIQAARDEHSVRTPPLFAGRSRARQSVAVIVIPILFGVVAAFMLKWAEPAWWTWQGLGILGATIAGLEHLRWWSAALRGAVAGLVAALTVVGIHTFLPGKDMTDFDPVAFPIYAFIASAGLHALGTVLRRRTPATGVDAA
ncbi:hypothetical protein [Amycolatopsis sp. GM8]|uniref:hypothetical protein n=1 Tax=Amycolatopsis sp. GM8 TaxID=2896530 RepID=UPI001F3A2892|nr:hypothetical protein [Amycolatopsis sp. GM8]